MTTNTTSDKSRRYGELDASYRAAGMESGLRKLCEDFYKNMSELDEASKIRDMHGEDLSSMVDKLTLFLCMWLGGPSDYRSKFGSKSMPMAHQHLVINEPERDAWLLCMDKAIDAQSFAPDFKVYLKNQLRFPAEMIRKTSLS